MRHFPAARLLILLLIVTAGCACTRNNGDIGPLFGDWRLECISVEYSDPDGSYRSLTERRDSTFFQFQNQVVQVRQLLPRHEYNVYVGRWSRPDPSTLVLDFDNHEDKPSGGYRLPANLYLPPAGATLAIRKLTRSSMILSYETDETILTYSFKKW